jgi:hypothetical protein
MRAKLKKGVERIWYEEIGLKNPLFSLTGAR